MGGAISVCVLYFKRPSQMRHLAKRKWMRGGFPLSLPLNNPYSILKLGVDEGDGDVDCEMALCAGSRVNT